MAGPKPPGYDENPTVWTRRIFLAVLASLGLGVSAYLTLFQIGVIPSVWDPFFQSPKVLEFLGFPDAALGVLAYGTEVVLSFIGGRDRWRTMPWAVLAFGAVILSGAIVSVLLIFMQAVLVGAWCTLCLASAAISFAIFGFGVDEPLAGLRYLRRVRDSGGSLWHALWGMDGAGKGGSDRA
jgi:uncharacterized membrane protein